MGQRLLKHDGSGQAKALLKEFANAVEAFDPLAASRAQILMMRAELSKLSERLAAAETELQLEHQETGALRATYDQFLVAARRLERQVDGARNEEIRRELETSFARLIEQLERLNTDIAREQSLDSEAAAWAGVLRAAQDNLAAKLLRVDDAPEKSYLSSADQSRLRKAELGSKGRSGAANLTTAMSSISAALDVMNRSASHARAEERIANASVRTTFELDRLQHDPHIAAALNIAPPLPLISGKALRHRLARLEASGLEERATSQPVSAVF